APAPPRERDSVRARPPHLEATYGCARGAPRRPSIEEMLMIEPPPADVIGSTTARIPKNVPVRLTSMTWRHLLRSKVPRRPNATVPALLTRTSSLPNRDSVASTAAD